MNPCALASADVSWVPKTPSPALDMHSGDFAAM
jgi:hypothetical protein